MLFTPRRGSRTAPWLLMNKLFLFLATGLIACGGTGSAALDGGSDLSASDDLSVSCEYPQDRPAGTSNDARCPAVYGGSSTQDLCAGVNVPCSDTGLSCSYYGVGDGCPGCYAIAVMWCGSHVGIDGGAFVWTCAN